MLTPGRKAFLKWGAAVPVFFLSSSSSNSVLQDHACSILTPPRLAAGWLQALPVASCLGPSFPSCCPLAQVNPGRPGSLEGEWDSAWLG